MTVVRIPVGRDTSLSSEACLCLLVRAKVVKFCGNAAEEGGRSVEAMLAVALRLSR